MNKQELITKYEITLKTIQEVISNSELNEDTLTAQGCERFVKEFLAELKILADQPDPKPEWISVSERLPEKFIHVLVGCGKIIEIGYLGSMGWETQSGNIIGVTHWMPLPTPPKK